MLGYLLVYCLAGASAQAHTHNYTHTITLFLRAQYTTLLKPEKGRQVMTTAHWMAWVSTVICRHGPDSLWNATRHKGLVSLITFLSLREGGFFIPYSQPAGFTML